MDKRKITVGGKEYWWNIQWRALYEDEEMTKPVRTKFFTDEQTRELHKRTKDLAIQIPNDERSVATDPESE